MAKYDPLHDYLTGVSQPQTFMKFQEVERVLGFKLPDSARAYREWWANEQSSGSRHTHCKSWLAAGYKVDAIDLVRERVTFSRGSW